MSNANTSTTPPSNPPLTRSSAFKQLMTGDKQRQQIAAQLPKGVDVDRFVRTAMTTVAMKPELLTCTFPSLMGAIMLAAKDGLLPDGKEAVIQVYSCNVAGKGQPARWEKQAQYQPMLRGLLNILYRSGEVALIDGMAVYERDEFDYERGDAPRIYHKPYLGAEDPGPVIAAYAIITLTNGQVKREVMTARDIAKVRSVSKAADGPGWTKWGDQYAIKAVLKRAYKQLPIESEDIDRVIHHDNLQFDLEQDTPEAIKVDAKPGQPSRLKAIINQAQAPLEQAPLNQPQSVQEPVYFGEDGPNLEGCPAYDR